MSVEAGLQAQLRNIEQKHGRSIPDWISLITASGLTKHGEVVAMLKDSHGLSHGTAHRLALVAREASSGRAPDADPVAALYAGDRASLRPVHDALMAAIAELGAFEVAPKRGYLSLRRRKQFAMIRPASRWVDLGLILPDRGFDARFASAATFNALFTHRVKVTSPPEVDAELRSEIRKAYEAPAR